MEKGFGSLTDQNIEWYGDWSNGQLKDGK